MFFRSCARITDLHLSRFFKRLCGASSAAHVRTVNLAGQHRLRLPSLRLILTKFPRLQQLDIADCFRMRDVCDVFEKARKAGHAQHITTLMVGDGPTASETNNSWDDEKRFIPLMEQHGVAHDQYKCERCVPARVWFPQSLRLILCLQCGTERPCNRDLLSRSVRALSLARLCAANFS